MLFVSNKKTVRGALARMIFVLATIIHKGEGDFESEHLMEQFSFQTEPKSQMLSSLNWTTPSAEGSMDHNNSTGKRDDIENEITYIGYGHDPWGPSTLMSSEENGGSRSKGRNSQRPRRDVVHLYNMVSCATGCNPIIYKGYGCYCGFLGSGAPIDGIDRCCKMHDWCYNTANCPMFFEYIIPYYWKCYHRRPICAIDHGEYGGPGSCAQRLCECDRLLSECLSHYRCPKKRAVCRTSPVRFLIQSFFMF